MHRDVEGGAWVRGGCESSAETRVSAAAREKAGCGEAKARDWARSNFAGGTLPIGSAWEAETRARCRP